MGRRCKLTEEKKRRQNDVQNPNLPDTGKRPPVKNVTIAEAEKMARMQRSVDMAQYGDPYPTAIARLLRDLQKQERQFSAGFGPPSASDVELDRIENLTDPLLKIWSCTNACN
jgi:hypothetical protein